MCGCSNNTVAVIGVRAFTTSQSADAHFALIKRIFDIASTDTSLPVQFLHIHGEGFEAWVADAHKGQALGKCYFSNTLVPADIKNKELGVTVST